MPLFLFSARFRPDDGRCGDKSSMPLIGVLQVAAGRLVQSLVRTLSP